MVPGQRWVSESEPELGLGTVLAAGFRDVTIRFEAAGETRVYMRRNAPLRRVRLQPGDRARSRDGRVFVVRRVEEQDGLLVYRGVTEVLDERELLDHMTFSDPDKRLLAAKVDKPRAFALRLRTLEFRRALLGRRVRGLAGARMQLLPHQLGIAYEIASRRHPRVLLADEVGLGKTIEAGLVFHRLYVTGQIQRVLIVTPSQLVHQWMVELYRRFNHMFTVLDEDLCRAEEKGDASINPFALRQTILCAADFLAADRSGPRRVEQARAAGVDLLIVDEAHHLSWSPESSSPAYRAVESLTAAAGGVLLLTATPIQLGQAGHFGRLRLLDPDRFTSLPAYLAETRRYQELAQWADALLAAEHPEPQVLDALRRAFPDDSALHARLAETAADKPGARERLIEDLVDRHGTGRLMFRNRRQALGGFPRRVVQPAPLDQNPAGAALARALFPEPEKAFADEAELARYLGGAPAVAAELRNLPGDSGEMWRAAWAQDPRLAWLVDFLRQHPSEKILLICAHKAVVFALQEILPTLTTATFASFHENLAMATRDRNAAYFSEPDGAQLLLCSEIGSEGRNFQFAHHLILFDLPLDPAVLEQRIGRLDRIGQHSDIHLHIPYLRGTPQAVVFRWYHEGLNALRDTVLGADTFHETLIGSVLDACRRALVTGTAEVADLIRATKAEAARVRAALEQGRDRLLELNSNKTELAAGLIAEIQAQDDDPDLQEYLEEVFDHFGLDVEATTAQRGAFVLPGERMLLDAFPEVPESGLGLTYDRDEALAREDLAFMTLDHPLVRGTVDLLLEGQEGTAGFAAWPAAPAQGMALEAVFVLAATAPGALHLDRFLPPTPLRVLVDEKGESLNHFQKALDAADLEMAPTGMLEEHHESFARLIPKWLEAAQALAAIREATVKKAAHHEAEKILGGESERLRALQPLNPGVSEAQVRAAEEYAAEVLRHIAAAELRLDAVRLILLGKTRD